MGKSLSEKKELLSLMTEENNKVTVLEDRRKTFQDLLNQWGYKSPTDFLIECEFIPNPSVKKPRVKITDEVRQNIVTDLKSGVPTKEISSKYGVTEDAIYNIKGKSGLTKPRTKTTPSPSVTVPTPPKVETKTTVPSPNPTLDEFEELFRQPTTTEVKPSETTSSSVQSSEFFESEEEVA